MKKVIVGLLLFSGAAHAEIYKCMTQGKPSYQQEPCEGSGEVLKSGSSPADAMVGCWSSPALVEGGYSFRFEITNAGNSRYDLLGRGPNGKFKSVLKRATSAELKRLRESIAPLHAIRTPSPYQLVELSLLGARDGLSVDYQETIRDRWHDYNELLRDFPFGIYRVVDRDGSESYVMYLAFAQPAVKSSCLKD
jgi:hypothetical protein